MQTKPELNLSLYCCFLEFTHHHNKIFILTNYFPPFRWTHVLQFGLHSLLAWTISTELINVNKSFPMCYICWLKWIFDISAPRSLREALNCWSNHWSLGLDHFQLTTLTLTHSGSSYFPSHSPFFLKHRMCALHPLSWPLIWPNWVQLFPLLFLSLLVWFCCLLCRLGSCHGWERLP